ncbi:MAG: iron-sulfur cluster-binding protein [Flavobacteriales bacterium]|nr:iron-sulfur cluster-binding protein [Flavobacteriales bacterium]MCB9449616.1 iron-sulfur cluster-binding protein [Flavobacteriales bacterium]
MDQKTLDNFLKKSENKAFDKEHRRKLVFNITQYDNTVVKGKQQFSNLELARQRAASRKFKAIENLDKYLIEFEANFTRNGGKVIWARNTEEAQQEILKILQSVNAKSLVKSKSMITEEIHLNHFLEQHGIESVETDLGEYIVQMAGETPYHIVTPAMHKSKEDVAKLFHEKVGTPLDSTPQDITAYVRKELREKYQRADAGISGANFLLADSGSIALTENEGNAYLSVGFPKVHITVVGLEKILPSMNDLALFWPLLATHGTGQNMTVYNHIVSGPRKHSEVDGPDEMYVVLLDNGRTELLSHHEQRQALHCIRCGACLNACPIYQSIGGHSYGTTYSGPIGSVITPHFDGMEKYRHLSFASSLCGRCTEVCPVRIDVHKLLMLNRRDVSVADQVPKMESRIVYFWKKAMLNRKLMEMGGSSIKNMAMKYMLKGSWGKHREVPRIAPKSFSRLWREKKGMF